MPSSRTVSLAQFQDAFARVLVGNAPGSDGDIACLTAQPAFSVYRNTVAKGCIDALQANFPAVAKLVGEEWFRAAAARFAQEARPREASLLAYGDAFPAFLSGFAPARELPYLADVARLDRLWTETHAAADDVVLDASALAGIDAGDLAAAVLRLHPATRWAFFAEAPIFAIWRRNRTDDDTAAELEWRGDGALLTRPRDAVRWRGLDAAGARILEACGNGLSVEAALEAALEADPQADLPAQMAALLDAGAFSRIAFPCPRTR